MFPYSECGWVTDSKPARSTPCFTLLSGQREKASLYQGSIYNLVSTSDSDTNISY